MAIREDDFLSEIIGINEYSDRIHSFIWLCAAQINEQIFGFNIDADPIVLRDTLATCLNNNKNYASWIKSCIQYSSIPIDRLNWILETKIQLRWLEIIIRNRLQSTYNTVHGNQHQNNFKSTSYNPSQFRMPAHLTGKNASIAVLDYYAANSNLDPSQLIFQVATMEHSWHEQLEFNTHFDWMNDDCGQKKRELYLKQASTKYATTGNYHSIKHYHDDFIIYLLNSPGTNLEKLIFNKNARNRWNQQIRREKEKYTKKQCNFNLPIGIDQKLSALAEKHELSRVEIIEILVRYESRKHIYMNEWLQRKPTHDILQK